LLVISGFFENGVFTPNNPVISVKGRWEATLTINEDIMEQERRERIKRWGEIKKMLADSGDETLEGEPERIHLRTPDEIEAL
jgi:hypothetical protein